MATCTFNIGKFSSGNSGAIGAWLKVPASPAQNLAIIEIYAPSQGHLLFSLHTDGTLWISGSVNGHAVNSQVGSAPLLVGTWYWLSVTPTGVSGVNAKVLVKVTRADGTVLANFYAADLGAGSDTLSAWTGAVFEVGQSLAEPSMGAWPTSAGWELSKMICNGAYGDSVIPAPSVDWAGGDAPASGFGGFYNCRGSQGSTTTLTDDSGNGFHLLGNFVIWLDGPYAI